jgi:hypothetical protein
MIIITIIIVGELSQIHVSSTNMYTRKKVVIFIPEKRKTHQTLHSKIYKK